MASLVTIGNPGAAGNPLITPPWLPASACLLAGIATAGLICPEPFERPPSPGTATIWALVCVVLVAAAAASVARVAFTAFTPADGEAAGHLALKFAGLAVWFVPLAVFLAQGRPWSLAGAVLAGWSAGRLLRGCGQSPQEEANRSTLRFAGLPDLPPRGAAFAAATLLEGGVATFAVGSAGPAALMAGLGCFLAAGSPSLPIPPADPARVGKHFLLPGICAAAVATLGMIRLPGSEIGVAPIRQRGAPAAHAALTENDLFSGAILLTQVPLKLALPSSPSSLTRSLRSPRPAPSIEFSGEYWIFPLTLLGPLPDSLRDYATPLNYKFTAVDRTALAMQAWQRLPSAVDLRCCSAIEVALQSSDPQPETIAVGLWLSWSQKPGRRHRAFLGSQQLPPAEFSTLRFPLPARTALPRFDEILVDFDLKSPRMQRSAKVAIREFVFVRR